MSRRFARDISFKYIYASLYGACNLEDTLESIITVTEEEVRNLDSEEKKYFDSIVFGIKENEEKIDEIILSKLKNWSIERIFKIDLAILRLAIYEIMYMDSIPPKVTVNEAVELAKKYGNDNSYNFVNGVLREVIKVKES